MRPVGIFRFSATEGPGYFAEFLASRRIDHRLIAIDRGDAIPYGNEVGAYSGFALMGGPMSVNDDLPWIPRVLAAIRAADAADRPCIGHCLGGQLIARALGGTVTQNPVREIGWHPVTVEANATAAEWLGLGTATLTTFQWHGDTFSLPPGATRIATGPHCANQAYVVGKHLGMQCHIEMTPEMIATWLADGSAEIAEFRGDSVQDAAAIRSAVPARLPELRSVADRCYERWIEGLVL